MEKKYCKFVTEDMRTMYNTKWKINVRNKLGKRKNYKLGNNGLFHYVSDPLIAAFTKDGIVPGWYTKLYEVKPEGDIVEGPSICGSTELTLIKELEIPQVTELQRSAFAILAASEVNDGYDVRVVEWAEKWLSGEDRSRESAQKIEYLDFQIFHCEYNTTDPYHAACNAARSCVTSYTGYKIYYANCAVDYAEKANPKIDLISLAKKAMEIQ